MKRIILIMISICLSFIFVSCSFSNENKYTNPYQSYEETTKIKDNFNSEINDIEKITITIADKETAIDVNTELLELLTNANTTTEQPSEDLSTILAYVKIYYISEKVIDYGRIYTDSNANVYLVSNYNQNEKSALLIKDKKIIGNLIFQNNNILFWTQ